MQIDVQQGGRARLFLHDVRVPDFFDDGFWLAHEILTGETYPIAATIASPTCSVVAGRPPGPRVAGPPAGLRWAVTVPAFSTASIAALTAAASSFNPKLYSSMAATEP